MSYELLNLIKSSETSLTKMVNLLNESPSVCLSSLDPNQTALIIVD
ncbi:cysteine hydrolase, partial [Turicibacter sanguinis]|nr:cysteine hydrolase [Turicibacter sanguinis]